MRRRAAGFRLGAALAAALATGAATGAAGQVAPAPDGPRTVRPPARGEAPRAGAPGEVTAVAAASQGGARLRVLDKIDGTLTDLDLRVGGTAEVGGLSVTLGDCRVPVDNPAGDAFALVSIRTTRDETAVFEGWLLASSPALSAVDHPRYDVWALACAP